MTTQTHNDDNDNQDDNRSKSTMSAPTHVGLKSITALTSEPRPPINNHQSAAIIAHTVTDSSAA